MVKVSDHSWHVTSSSPVPLKTRRVGKQWTLNLSRAQPSSRWCGVVRQASVHEWYEGNRLGAALNRKSSMRNETILTRFRRGHARAQRLLYMLELLRDPSHSCHIMACIGCHKSQLLSSPATVLCLKTHGFMDLT
ncbi:hypothetical protein TNCV_2192501 [Trichonephila clavipes]|nr:hypothetical protein TNCV_2192501 [Trichonephila clavipes]